jgi:hypothetical protein
MNGWCPRCDAVRQADGTCPHCQAPLVDMDERPVRPAARREEPAAEVATVVEPPPRGRLRVALAVAAAVLVGVAFVAGRGTGGGAARTAPRSASATTQTTAPPAVELQRQLGWRSKPVNGIQIEVVAVSRIPSDTVNGEIATGDNDGSLSLRVHGLAQGRRLLGITGLRLVDSGGGVFAEPDSRQIGGVEAVPVQLAAGRYLVDLGPTPSVDTLDRIQFQELLLSASPASRGQLELPTGGAWPARPPMRAVEPAVGSVSVPVVRPDGSSSQFPLRVSSAFVGAGRAVVVLSFDEEIVGRDLGLLPVSFELRDGKRVVCSRLTLLGLGQSQVSPLLVIDCPTSPAPVLTVDLAAGIQPVRLDTTLSA